MEKISIIVANYNNDKYLCECIESVLNQSYTNLELIIVDDFSCDNSEKIINRYEILDKRVKGIFLKSNQGVSNARNTGVRYSTGKYITFLDSDDFYINSNKLYREMELIRKFKYINGKDIIAYSTVVRVNEKGGFLEDQGKNKIKFLKGNIACKLVALYKPSRRPRDYCFSKYLFIKSGGYNISTSFYEDFDLLVRLSMQANFYCTYEYGTAYRIKNTGLSRRSPEEHKQVQKEIAEKYCHNTFFQRKGLIINYLKTVQYLYNLLKNADIVLGGMKQRFRERK